MHKIIIKSVNEDIIRLEGNHNFSLGEMVKLTNESKVIVMAARMNSALGVIVNRMPGSIKAGDTVQEAGNKIMTKFSTEQLGRVVNSIGDVIDSDYKIKDAKFIEIEQPAVPMLERELVNQPLETGILSIDSMIPIGKGQRELIIGDRQTGKTSIAIDTIISQARKGVYAVYVLIGQKSTKVIQLQRILRKNNIEDKVVIVAASASEGMGMQYLAPYSGASIAMELAKTGKDVVIVYDDLTKHSDIYRGMSLLLKKPPGREAYPGDIFYLHSRLLERAGRFSKKYGGGSITALPIVETQADDLTAYVPTNLVSITDGQIYTSSSLFAEGQLPAIDVTLSVSRIGSVAQREWVKKLSSSLKMTIAQYEDVKRLSQISGNITDENRIRIRRGDFIKKTLLQQNNSPLTISATVYILNLIKNHANTWMSVSTEDFEDFKDFLSYFFTKHPTGIALEERMSKSNLDIDIEKDIYDLLKPTINHLAKKYNTLPSFAHVGADKQFVKAYEGDK